MQESRLCLLLGRCHNPRLYGSCICVVSVRYICQPQRKTSSPSLSMSGIFVSLSQPAFHSSVCLFLLSYCFVCVFSANGCSASAFLLSHTHTYTHRKETRCAIIVYNNNLKRALLLLSISGEMRVLLSHTPWNANCRACN